MADVGPHDEPSPMGRLRERLDELRRAWERGAGGLVFHELDPREQPTPPHVAHVGQLGEGSEAALQDSAELGAPLDELPHVGDVRDRKSTRLNSSHSQISYAVFCLKKKKKHHT